MGVILDTLIKYKHEFIIIARHGRVEFNQLSTNIKVSI
jgi:hypothetical protein